jgi:hypothetical protein
MPKRVSIANDCGAVLDAFDCEAEDTPDVRVVIKNVIGRSLLKVSWSIAAEVLYSALEYGNRMCNYGHGSGFNSAVDLLV